MPTFIPITRQSHAARRFQRHTNYAFASGETSVPLVGAESPKAALAMPLAFLERAGRFFPVALMGLEPGRNLFVAPDGRWVGGYIPAAFRGYPFALAKTAEGQQVLCVAEDSGLVSDGPDGEAFFTEEGKPTQAVAEILNFLRQVEKSRAGTEQACACLQKYALIQPWPITLKTPTGDRPVAGLFRIDEVALNALPGDALRELQQTGALPLAYCQLLSMQHLALLGKLAEAQAKAAQAQAAKPKVEDIAQSRELDLEFMNSGTIGFGGMGG